MALWAYIKYKDDGKTYVCPIEDVDDFEDGSRLPVKKWVRYSDGHFYKAFVICTGATKEEVSKKALAKRVIIPPNRFDETTEGEEGEDDANEKENKTMEAVNKNEVKKNKKKKYNKVVPSATENFREILNMELLNDQDQTAENAKIENTKIEKYLKDLKSELKDIKCLQKKIEKRLEATENVQEQILAKLEEIHFENNENRNADENNIPVIAQPRQLAIGERSDGNVHLGDGIMLPYAVYDNIIQKKKPSLFIKELAVALFSEEVLASSTVMGRSGKKPGLDPTKLLAMRNLYTQWLTNRGLETQKQKYLDDVERVLTEKIQDLRRPARTTKPKRKTGQIVEENTELEDAAELTGTAENQEEENQVVEELAKELVLAEKILNNEMYSDSE